MKKKNLLESNTGNFKALLGVCISNVKLPNRLITAEGSSRFLRIHLKLKTQEFTHKIYAYINNSRDVVLGWKNPQEKEHWEQRTVCRDSTQWQSSVL